MLANAAPVSALGTGHTGPSHATSRPGAPLRRASIGGAGLFEDIGARVLRGAAQDLRAADEPFLGAAVNRLSEQWERRGALLDRTGAGVGLFGDWADHAGLFEHEADKAC
ncbi:hypothetical protein [Actinacidiphila sp. ITFR-21]|uniref:hypothetical protein n=1 Tax=Actinacidiphila sp. ITFR-21 TaxID=3075199 RepID=UPI00288AB22A|nr:hypothetical protein [Streptomyces sp. ITFR-21]WNI16417.1 hypothetical protein RLT57_13435 [Streptomyces sp. ITFR-21]